MHTTQIPSLNNSERYSIHSAIRQHDTQMLELLLKKQPELLNQIDAEGRSPLHLAALENHEPTIRYLISKGADINMRINCPTDSSLHNKTALECARALGYLGSQRTVITLIKAGAHDTPLDGSYLFHKALSCKDTDMLELLLKKQPELVNQINAYGLSPLHLAARRNDLFLVRYLISKGANINMRINCPTDSSLHNKTVLECAKVHNYSKFTVKALIAQEGAFDISLDDNYLMHQATRWCDTDMLELLLKKQPELVNRIDDQGLSPLHLAARENHEPTIRYLISKGADINLRINYPKDNSLHNKTVLECARAHGYDKSRSAVKTLIKAGALDTPLNGNYLIHTATRKGDTEMLELLLKNQPELVNQIDADGLSPLHFATSENHEATIRYLISEGADNLTNTKTIDLESQNSISSILTWLGFHRHKTDQEIQKTSEKFKKETVNNIPEQTMPLQKKEAVVLTVPATVFYGESRAKKLPSTEEEFMWRNEW
ncbi:MAG: ankyrin repeat domain-containing protein [Legionellaceae bacterium]|nr:ankyrin repeat domain-containing protein [Legionellaceae bacterium]